MQTTDLLKNNFDLDITKHKKNFLSEKISLNNTNNLSKYFSKTNTNFNISRKKLLTSAFQKKNFSNIIHNFKKLENFKRELNININSPINSNLNTIETVESTKSNTDYSKTFYTKFPIKKNKEKIRKFKLIEPEGKYIPGTKIKTIFNEEARKFFLYKRIFFYFDEIVKKMFTREHKYINNIINIDYAENEKVYEERLKKINDELLKQGKKIKYFTGPSYSKVKIKELQYGVSFMKCVVDYSYPYMVLARVNEKNKDIKKLNALYKLPTFKIVDYENKSQENKLKNYLLESINIQNFKKNWSLLMKIIILYLN